MTLSTQALSHARKLAVAVVAVSLGGVALLALAVPPAVAGLLPALVLAVPFIAASIVDGAIDDGSAHA